MSGVKFTMNNQILSRLKELQKVRGDTNAFANHDEFLSWSDSVSPLLEIDEALHNNFIFWSEHVKSSYRMGRDHHHALGESIGVVNQAITKLELQPEQKPTEKETNANAILYPQKLTLKWLYQHAPISLWGWLCGLLFATFVLGIAFSETQLYQLLKNKTSDSVAASELKNQISKPPSDGTQ
nr:hypothetical protein [Pseudomonas sp. NFPP33]